jgi:hypothetical protein
MNRIEGISDQPKQQMTLVLADGSNVSFFLEYRANQLGWFYSIGHDTFQLDGQRLVTSPSVLKAFRSSIPFDLAVLATNNVEPMNLRDFVDGTASIYLLEGDDLAAVDAAVYPGD